MCPCHAIGGCRRNASENADGQPRYAGAWRGDLQALVACGRPFRWFDTPASPEYMKYENNR
jgi:hypothetical protein